MASNRHLAVPPIAIRRRRVADPFDGLWDREMRPMLEAHRNCCGGIIYKFCARVEMMSSVVD
jgi:hypothetical protein